MPPSPPLATYRLQLTPSFGFDHAAAIVSYLKTLGVSHVYASPFLKARAGSLHGYDIVDFAAPHSAARFLRRAGENPGRRRAGAAFSRRRGHDGIGMAQRHLPSAA